MDRPSLAALAIVIGIVILLFTLAKHDSQPLNTHELDLSESALISNKTDNSATSLTPSATLRLGTNEEKNHKSVQQQNLIQGMREHISAITTDFRYNMQFPPYSKPLNEGDWALLNPRAYSPTHFPLDNQGNFFAHLEINQFIVDINLDLPVRVIFTAKNAANPIELSSVNLSIKQGNKLDGKWMLSSIDNQTPASHFEGIIPAKSLVEMGAGELLIIAELTLSDGSIHHIGGRVETFSSVATIIAAEPAFIEGSHLIIPIKVRTEKPGLYRINANLFDEKGKRPLAHIANKADLSLGLNQVNLKIHSVTLKHAADEGPYLLKSFTLKRSPAKPGEQTTYGTSDIESVAVAEFSFDQYLDEQYVDEKAQQRLEYLEQIAKTNKQH